MSIQPIAVPSLQLDEQGDHPGFSIGDFKYHDGFSITRDGQRVFSISFRHRHPHFEIFWIRSGQGTIERDCDLIDVAPRSLLILAPGDIHKWKETRNLEGSLLAVSQRFTSSSNFMLPFSELTSFLQPNGSRLIHLNPSEHSLIRNLFDIIRASESDSAFDQQEVLKALLLILFSKIRGFYVGRGASEMEHTSTLLTRGFKQALMTECPRLATVKQFAEFLKVSRSYLHRSVLHDTGRSPSELIRERLIFEAKRMLIHTNNSSAEIGRHLGFRSSSYFSSFFHRHTQLSPKAFRSRLFA
jgi:AraC-like DNA-binding protein/mannose-6-phosphate isomerase-like protein (cupin superfamily)